MAAVANVAGGGRVNQVMTALRDAPARVRGAGRFGDSLKARAALAPRVAIKRHLILAYRPGWQEVEDLTKIAHHVADLDPSIRTFVMPTTHRNGASRKQASTRPTLVVSPGPMVTFKPIRGKVYEGWPIPKIDEIRRLERAGVPAPRTELLTPRLKLDPDEWGEFVVLKPTDQATSSHGVGIQLIRTRRVRYVAPADYPAGHPGRLAPMIVQRYVPSTGVYRVLVFMGEVMCAYALHLPHGINLAAPDEVIERTIVATQATEVRRVLTREPEVLALARTADRALPEIPLKGCDLIRDTESGRLYVLELNSGGNTWHFSSHHFAEARRRLGIEFQLSVLQQFDAFRTAARTLVARTNAEAE